MAATCGSSNTSKLVKSQPALVKSIFGVAGRPADFLKIAPGPIFNPQGGENRIPHAEIFRFQPLKQYFDRFLKNQNFKKFDFSKIDHFLTFYRYFGVREH